MREFINNQLKNVFLWVPFLLAAGGAVFFTLPWDINIFVLIGVLILCSGLFYIERKNIFIRAICIMLFGFTYAGIFTTVINTPTISRDIHDREITGCVVGIDYTDTKSRLMLRVSSTDIDAMGHDRANIRLSIIDLPTPNIGDTVRVTANIYPPATPYTPGAFDYARWSYFNNLTAMGYITEIEILNHANTLGINNLRDRLHVMANSFLVDTLVLGYKNAIPDDQSKIWTATGIGHVWSISGFHMTLLSTWLFAIFWFIFRRIPYITRRVTARSTALIASWFGLLFYLFLSGIDIATIRAFLMTTLIFAAFIFGRGAISMRNVCIAFCIIFLINPHYVMQAGFQLSFAAIFGLVWFWGELDVPTPKNKILKIIYVAALTSIIAGIFTTPFVIAHFGAIPIYSLIGNLILLPIFSIVIMPLVFIGTLTTTFGWNWPLNAAKYCYDTVYQIAQQIASIPGANLPMPDIPNMAMAIIIFGFCTLMFIRARHAQYIIFITCIFIGTVITTFQPRPIFFASYDHELVAFVRDEKITFNKSRAANHFFAFDTWKHSVGIPTDTPNKREKHNRGVYKFETEKFNLVYIQKFTALYNNIAAMCADENIDYIVSYFDTKSPSCKNKILPGAFVMYPNGKIQKINLNRRWHGTKE